MFQLLKPRKVVFPTKYTKLPFFNLKVFFVGVYFPLVMDLMCIFIV